MIAAPITQSALQIAARASVPLPSPEGGVTADSTTVTADSTIITADNE